MTTRPGLPAGFAARAPLPEDLDAVADVVAACERADTGTALTTREDVEADWALPSFDLTRDAVVVVDGTTRVVAWAEVYRRRAGVSVHPGVRARGVGTWLLAWAEARARAAGLPTLRQTVPVDSAAADLLRDGGYEVAHTSWVLEIALDAQPAAPDPPDGIVVRAFLPASEERAAYRVVEEAFSVWPGREPTSFEDWVGFTIGRPQFDPALLQVAVDGERIVGAAVALDYPAQGQLWVAQLAVDAAHRGRGIGGALLRSAFAIAWERGRRSCGLSTDSRTGAIALYERAGMHVESVYSSYVKTL